MKFKELILHFISYRQAEYIKTLIAFIFYYSGAAFLVEAFSSGGASILVYHSVSDGESGIFCDNIVFPGLFEKQIAYLSQKYRIVPLSLLIERLESKKEVPADWVVLTFDDGYKDNLSNALPVIKKYDASATFYVTTKIVQRNNIFFYDLIQMIIDRTMKKEINVMIDGKTLRYDLSTERKKNDAVLRMVLNIRVKSNEERAMFVEELKNICSVQIETSDEKERLYLSVDDLQIMKEHGIELGSHSVSHANLPGLSAEELDEETAGSKRILEDIINSNVRSFSYPFGKKNTYNENVIKSVKQAGYQSAVTTNRGKVDLNTGLFELLRIGVGNTCLTRLKVNLMGIPL